MEIQFIDWMWSFVQVDTVLFWSAVLFKCDKPRIRFLI